MDGIVIAPVTRDTLPSLETALRRLAADLGDEYAANLPELAAAVCGPEANCLAFLAQQAGETVGALLAARVFSTMRGGMGMYVSDLWVAEIARGQGVARLLLAETVRAAERRKEGHFLKLTVYLHNPGARAAYDQLGFTAQSGESNMILTGAPLEALKGAA